jgi:hypothetical protein
MECPAARTLVYESECAYNWLQIARAILGHTSTQIVNLN